jgi:hypothetical protein
MRITFASIFFLTIFLTFVNAGEAQLRFDSLANTDPIIIPREIDFKEFDACCTIKYAYDGDWIGGCSRKKFCIIFRNYFYYAHLTYLDENNKELFRINLPDSLKVLRGIRVNLDVSGFGDNFAFKEGILYSTDLQLLSSQFFQFEKLRELISTKRIHKIRLDLEKVVVKWDYSCENLQPKERRKEKVEKVKKQGEFVLKVDKTYFIEIKYEKEATK